ncbi:MAG TPA: hypothetical protein VF173_24695 [Thermoanaerobaculia bacterium]|nr:hypothetical protein [Thermoanaerobaculia bacterium]
MPIGISGFQGEEDAIEAERPMKPRPSLPGFLATLLLLATLCTLRSADVFAQSNLPHFKDYPVGEVYKGPTAPLVLTRDDLRFKTRLRWAVKNQKPNFAGHYILTSWGCGAECLMGAAIDAQTGRVYWWNFTLCCWGADVDDKFNPIEFRPGSRLIVFSGLRNEKDGDAGAHFYRFENGRFVHLRSILKPGQ